MDTYCVKFEKKFALIYNSKICRFFLTVVVPQI